jgi:hypothetical protein
LFFDRRARDFIGMVKVSTDCEKRIYIKIIHSETLV